MRRRRASRVCDDSQFAHPVGRCVSSAHICTKVYLQLLTERDIGGSIIVKQIGHATLTIDLGGGQKEEYIITLPRLRIDGLWYGSPYIELSENSYIQGSTGWLSPVSCFCLDLHLVETG